MEVLEKLPPELRECFETKSVAKLQAVAAAMPKEKFEEYMKLCVDSGLWVADAKSQGLTPASEELEKEMESLKQTTEKAAEPKEEQQEEKGGEDSESYEEVD